MTLYVMVENGICVGYSGAPDPADFTGPPAPPPDVPYACYQVADKQPLTGASPTERLLWNDGAPALGETATLDELKACKNDEINAARREAEDTYFNFGGKEIACDALSTKDINGTNAVIALTGAMPSDPRWPGAWKAMDNTYVALPDVAAWTSFITAMHSRGLDHFAHAQDLKNQLAAATTPEQVAAIVW